MQTTKNYQKIINDALESDAQYTGKLNEVITGQEEIRLNNGKKQEQEKCISNNGIKNDACISTIIEDNSTSNTKVSINNATLEELMTLPGIGEAKAKEIINYREEKGEFTDTNQLKEVKGIGDTLFESIKDNITL